MKTTNIKITYPSRSDCIKFVFIGDVHIGNSSCDEKLISDVVDRIARSDNMFWFDMGDRCDFVNMSDKRFDPASMPDWIGLRDLSDLATAQVNRFYHHFGKISEKCLGAVSGNHEKEIKKRFETDVYARINNKMELNRESKLFETKGGRILDVAGIARVILQRVLAETKKHCNDSWTLDVFLHHGYVGGRMSGSKVGALELLPMSFKADIYALAHSHTKIAFSKPRIGLRHSTSKAIETVPLVFINTGSFLRSYTEDKVNYAEEKLLYPQSLGPVELWIYPDSKEIKIVQ